jgi:CheY-like chemotaxis protein
VINDVLDFSKIEAGKLETSPHDFNVVRWVEEVIESFAPIAERKGLTLTYDLPPTMATRWNADADRLKQIATNLIGNAIKFTEKGSVSLRISIAEEDNESALVRFAVRDTGIGIPADRLSRLFQPFSQVDASTTRKYGGTGLGLAISRKLAELLGGELSVISQERDGSEFFWTARLRKTSSVESTCRPIPPQLQSIRAMVISSVPTDGDVLSSYLQRWGMECEQASDVSSAVVRIGVSHADDSIDVVLVDDALLGTDPSQTIHRLRSSAQPPTVMSLVPLGKIAASSQRNINGLAGYVTRPIIQSRLFDALVNAFEQRREAGPSNAPSTTSPFPSSSSVLFRGRSVLVAEDNEVNQFVIKEILQRQGLAVTLANTGREAVEQVQKHSFDLVLMDCQMPVMDGFQATRAIREWEVSTGSLALPIIALTASAIRGDRERCLEAGMNDYITKPIDQNRLKELLLKHLASPTSDRFKDNDVITLSFNQSDGDLIEPLDTCGLFERCSKDVDFAIQLLSKFITRLKGDRERIERELAHLHFQELARIGHSLLGAASSAGASLLAQAANQLEAGAREMDLETVQQAALHLFVEIDRLIANRDRIHEDLANLARKQESEKVVT